MTKKEQRRQQIKEAARQLFVEKNIEMTTFSEIAELAQVGEATVYRHYANKGLLAMEIAIDYAKVYSDEIKRRLGNHKGSHLEQFGEVLSYFIEIYQEWPEYFIYLSHFDDFISHSSYELEGLGTYEEMFTSISRAICDIDGGEVPDASIRRDVDVDLLTHTFSISFISLSQKMLLRGHVFRQDERYDPLEALELTKKMMLENIKANHRD